MRKLLHSIKKNNNRRTIERAKGTIRNNSRSKYFGAEGLISYFGFSDIGESHKERNIECQDYSRLNVIYVNNNPIVVGIISDGLGSCCNSAIGAALATNIAMGSIVGSILSSRIETNVMVDIIKKAMNYACSRIERVAKNNHESADAYSCTLSITIYDGQNLFVGHSGDCGVVAITSDGKYALITGRHKGTEINSVIPLSKKEFWEFLKVSNVAGVIMASDGVLDSFVRDEKEENRIFFPVIEPILNSNLNTEENTRILCDEYISYMNNKDYRKRVNDDISFIAIVNNKDIKGADIEPFDIERWKKDNETYGIQYCKSLYPDEEITDASIEYWKIKDDYLLYSLPQIIK